MSPNVCVYEKLRPTGAIWVEKSARLRKPHIPYYIPRRAEV
jgi:hypothetical protein